MHPSLHEQLTDSLGNTFRIERELGGGGMSRVFLAEERDLGRRVVVKVLPPELTTKLSFHRFRREILIAAGLRHPNIVPVLTASEAAGLAYYTMPYVEGESLRERLTRLAPGTTLPLLEVARILRDVARALAYAHHRAIVHRDIKPENILIAEEGALVCDFGVAKATRSFTVPHVESLTDAAIAVGTVAYMAPEQAAGDPAIDHRADIYAFGIVAYELLTGATPFVGRSLQDTLIAHAIVAPAPFVARRPGIPQALEDLVIRCLAKKPEARVQTAEELLACLERFMVDGSLEGAVVPKRRWYRRRSRLVWGGVSVALAASAGGIALVPAERRALLVTLASRQPPTLVANRYVILPFDNGTGDSTLNPLGMVIADYIRQAVAQVPNVRVEVLDARMTMVNEAIAKRTPWPLRSHRITTAVAEESSAGFVISGSFYAIGDSLRVRTTVEDLVHGATQFISDVAAPKRDPFSLIKPLQQRLFATVGFISDTAIVIRPGSYSDAKSLEAYQAFLDGMTAYFRNREDPAAVRYLRRAEEVDSNWVTPTLALAYLDTWDGRADALTDDVSRARRLAGLMSPAERALFDYVQAAQRGRLSEMLTAAQRFHEHTPGSMESPLLVSSTALGLRQPTVARNALRATDPDRGLNLVGGFYLQSLIGVEQSLGNGRAVLEHARKGERRMPRWILYRVYEARELARLGRWADLHAAIERAEMEHRPADAARAVVAAHAAAALLMRGRDADARRVADEYWRPAFTAYGADTSRWVQEAVANLLLIAGRSRELSTFVGAWGPDAGRPYFDRVSYAAVGSLQLGDTAAVTRAESILTATHPDLDFGHRELALARIASHRGNRSRTLQLLQQSADEGVRLQLLWGIGFGVDPFLAPLRGLAGFAELFLPIS
ncbi:MAG: protein kinase [Gemmatimonadetes bacterium]|nr:protein kinase [Gemmatimonadota bacterium]